MCCTPLPYTSWTLDLAGNVGSVVLLLPIACAPTSLSGFLPKLCKLSYEQTIDIHPSFSFPFRLPPFRPLTWDPPKFSMVNWESSETLFRLDRRPAYELLLCSSQLLGRPAASALVTGFSSATELNVGMPLPRWTTKLSSLPARLWETVVSQTWIMRVRRIRSVNGSKIIVKYILLLDSTDWPISCYNSEVKKKKKKVLVFIESCIYIDFFSIVVESLRVTCPRREKRRIVKENVNRFIQFYSPRSKCVQMWNYYCYIILI